MKQVTWIVLVVSMCVGVTAGPAAVCLGEQADTIRELKAHNKLLVASVETFRKQVKELKMEIAELRAAKASLRDEKTKLRIQYAEMSRQNAKARGENAKLRAQNLRLKAMLKGKPVVTTRPVRRPTKGPTFLVPAVTKGVIRAGLVSADISPIPLRNEITGDNSVSRRPLLGLLVAAINMSDKKKLNYRTWGAEMFQIGEFATLADELGNNYKAVYFRGANVPIGRTDEASLYPGKALTDVLIFEPPIAKAKRLTLSLPLKNLGCEGTIRLSIPIGRVRRR